MALVALGALRLASASESADRGGSGVTLPEGLFPGEGRISLALGAKLLAFELPRKLRLEPGERLEFPAGRSVRLAFRRGARPDSDAIYVSVLDRRSPDSGDLDASVCVSLPGFGRARPARFADRGGDDVFLLLYPGFAGTSSAFPQGPLSVARGFYDPIEDRGADLSAIDPAIALAASAGEGATPAYLRISASGRIPRGRETVIFHLRLVPKVLGRGRRGALRPPAGLGGWILPPGAKLEEDARRLLERARFPDGAYIEVGDGWQGKAPSALAGRSSRTWLAALREEVKAEGSEGSAGRRVARLVSGLRAIGVSSGLWIVPYGEEDEQQFREKPRAFVRDRDGRPVSDRFLGRYVVDGTSEEGLSYLRDLFRELAETGVEVVRIGGLGAAFEFYRNAEAELSRPGSDAIGVLRATIRAMREGSPRRLILAGDLGTPLELAGDLDALIPAAPRDSGVDPLWLEALSAARNLRLHPELTWVECLPVRAWALQAAEDPEGLAFREVQSRVALAAVTGRRLLIDGALWVPAALEGLLSSATLPGPVYPIDLSEFEEPPRVWALLVGGPVGGAVVAAVNPNPLQSASVAVKPEGLGLSAPGNSRAIYMDLERGTIAGAPSGSLDLYLLPGTARMVAVHPASEGPRFLCAVGDFRGTVELVSRATWSAEERTLRSRIEIPARSGEAAVRIYAGERYRFAGAEAGGAAFEAEDREGDVLLRIRAVEGTQGPRQTVELVVRFSVREGEADRGAEDRTPPRDLKVQFEPSERRPLLTWRAGEDSWRWWSGVSGFAILRDGVEIARTWSTAFLDGSAPPRGSFSYSVATIPAGAFAMAEAPRALSASAAYTAPEATDAFLDAWVPAAAPPPSRLALGRSAAGGPLAVGGAQFPRGLGVRAPSRIEYRLDGEYARFDAEIGVDDAAKSQGAVAFSVEADGAERFRSPALRGGAGLPIRIRVPVWDAQRLALVVEDASGGAEPALADWCGAKIIAAAGFRLARAHAHNDYRQRRPLLDALDRGFSSVEADVYLVDGKLLVGHDRSELRPERTLEALYLDPLAERVQRNSGSVYPRGGEFLLLVDIKAEGEAVYRALRDLLAKYREMLTEFREGEILRRAVTVIISGDRPRALIEAERERLVALDGRLPDLESEAPATLIPLVSDNWLSVFRWFGSGRMPEGQRRELRRLVEAAHARGRKLRFWGTPEAPALWAELLEAEVDLIGTDDLDKLEEFLRSAGARPKEKERGKEAIER